MLARDGIDVPRRVCNDPEGRAVLSKYGKFYTIAYYGPIGSEFDQDVTTSTHADSGATTSEQVGAVLANCHPTTRTAHQPFARLNSAPSLALGERPAQALAARLLLPVSEEAGRGHLIGRTKGGMNIKLHAVTAAVQACLGLTV